MFHTENKEMRLNINCPINTTSYGYVSSNFIKSLCELGCSVRHIPIGTNSPDEEIEPHIKACISRWDFFYEAPCIRIWHQHDLNPFYGKGTRIGFPIFELEDFNNLELHSLGNPDHLFVCSEWAKNVIQNKVISKRNNVSVVPLGYDPNIFKPCDLPDVEYTVFGNFGKWEKRKGHDVLVDIFNKAFEPDDNVLLVMMPHNQFNNEQENNYWRSKYKETKLGDKIIFVGRQRHHSLVYNIMSQVHCGIFPSRAEGWNLEALELLASGRHLIITNCTAHTEFCNSENSYLIDMDGGEEPAFDGKWFNGSFRWRLFGKDQIEQSVEYMRLVHRKRLENNLKINKVGIESVKKYTWENSSKIFCQKVNEASQ